MNVVHMERVDVEPVGDKRGSADEGALRLLADYSPPPYRVETVDLDLVLDAERTLVRSRLSISRAPGTEPSASLRLDGEDLELVSIALDGEPLSANRFAVDDKGMTLADPPEAFSLEILTAVHPARNTTRSGLFELQGKLATQCEAEGFRRITYFPDRPDILARYTVTLHADRARFPARI
jgi:aminopeptidase N